MYLQALPDCRLEETNLFLPDYQIPVQQYQKVKRAIFGIGGIWDTSSQSFRFKTNPSELFARICQGDKIDLLASFKKKTQYFPTTERVLRKMEDYIDIGNGRRVLEPSAGEGAICDFLAQQFPMSKFDWTLEACEKHAPFQEVLTEKGYNVIGTDFLDMPKPERGYHLIVANPPFSNGQDVQHFWKMYSLLAPGGRIVTVMSNSWREAKDKASVELREWLGYMFYSLEELPKGSFKQSGTQIAASFLVVDKPYDEAY